MALPGDIFLDIIKHLRIKELNDTDPASIQIPNFEVSFVSSREFGPSMGDHMVAIFKSTEDRKDGDMTILKVFVRKDNLCALLALLAGLEGIPK